ncbi:hypothetical protein NQZ79_g2917 [Umbelopsis isabellina]|nr:hypothetical protein NQZ79_g2917 [Umbelopsis isabellina]
MPATKASATVAPMPTKSPRKSDNRSQSSKRGLLAGAVNGPIDRKSGSIPNMSSGSLVPRNYCLMHNLFFITSWCPKCRTAI